MASKTINKPTKVYVVAIVFSNGKVSARDYFFSKDAAEENARKRGSRRESYSHHGYKHEVKEIEVK